MSADYWDDEFIDCQLARRCVLDKGIDGDSPKCTNPGCNRFWHSQELNGCPGSWRYDDEGNLL